MNIKKNTVMLVVAGAVTGLVNGFFGGGGGMIIVPLLSLFLGYREKEAHATALAVILPVSAISTIVYLFGKNIEWGMTLPVGLGVIVGGILGALLLKKINVKFLPKIFAVVMLVAGVKLLFF